MIFITLLNNNYCKYHQIRNMKKYILINIPAVIILTFTCTLIMAQNKPVLDRETSDRVLKTIQQLVTDSNYQKLGFASADDAKDLSIGAALPVSIIPLDKLKTLDSATGTLQSIKMPSQSAYYALISGRSHQTVALANVEMKDGKSVIRGVGSTGLANAISAASGRLSVEMRQSSELIRILALQLDFLAVTEQGTVYYIPLTSVPDVQIEKGSRLTEQSLLSKVLPLAHRYNGLPW